MVTGVSAAANSGCCCCNARCRGPWRVRAVESYTRTQQQQQQDKSWIFGFEIDGSVDVDVDVSRRFGRGHRGRCWRFGRYRTLGDSKVGRYHTPLCYAFTHTQIYCLVEVARPWRWLWQRRRRPLSPQAPINRIVLRSRCPAPRLYVFHDVRT